MAQKRTATRPASGKASRPRPRSGPSRMRAGMSRAARWVAATSAPHSASQFLTLALACLGLTTLVAEAVAAGVRRHAPGAELAWCGVLFVCAVAARTSPWWRHELETLTRDRLRTYAGSLALILA